ncbi:MAG: potassium transporter TrkG [Nanopusillaceae archaeon]
MNSFLLLLKIIGMIIKIFSFFNLILSWVALYFGIVNKSFLELYIAFIFAVIGFISYGIGYLLEKKIKITYEEIKNKPYINIIAIAISWLIIPLVGSIPYYFTGLSFIDAYFESMSAWSTTGFTFYQNINDLPNSIKFWRSFQQWIGGIGIIAFIVYLIKNNKILYSIVKFEGRGEFIEPTIEQTITKIFKLYAIITFIGISLLTFTGMPFFQSLNLSMTAIATGGMIPIDYLNLNSTQKIILIFLMISGATSFFVHSKIIEGKIKILKMYEPIKWLMILAIFSGILGLVSNNMEFIDSFFHSVSAITCTGFSYLKLNNISESYIFSLIILMLIGGAVGSTAGAIKIDRFIILFKGLKKKIKELTETEDTIVVETYINNIINDEDIMNAGLYFFIYVLILMISSIIFSFFTNNFLHALFEVSSAMGNVGLSLGYISPNMPILYKILFIFLMWGGRLEFITIITFFYSIIKKWVM